MVERSCRKALRDGTVRGKVVLSLIARELDPPLWIRVSIPEHLCLKEEARGELRPVRRASPRGGSCSAMNLSKAWKLYGMAGAFDETVTQGTLRQLTAQEILGQQ
jgi:hypothetical protein